MKLLIQKAKIVDKNSPQNGEIVDIFISKGKIEKIAKDIALPGDIKTISSPNLHVSAGWLDIGCQIGEPGLEYRETLSSAIAAARVGGYTSLAPFPNTVPVLQHKAAINVLKEAAEEYKINIYPIAAATTDCKGENITEMYDLHKGGAYAFTDGLKSITHNAVLLNALNYVKSFDGLIIHFSQDGNLAHGGQMHEGKISTFLGMKGIPTIAETIILKRDLALVSYADSKLCVYGVSSADAVKILKEAKNPKVSATVPYLNLINDDADLIDFNSNLKVSPPLRSKKDALELLKALKENTIQAIVSNHYPLDEEAKKLEFPYAKFGASGLETVFATINTFLQDKIDLALLIAKLSEGPRSILGIPQVEITEGANAELTLFDPSIEWNFNKTVSASQNNPYLGQSFIGKVLGTVVGNAFHKV